MKAFVFPGQGAQFEGMGKDLYENCTISRSMMDRANEVLGYSLTDVMFEGSAEDLQQTRITQPAIFLHSVVKAKRAGLEFAPDVVAGHSLGEFSALVAAGAIEFEDGLMLVRQRAEAMQKACEMQPGTMAAIVGLEDAQVEDICAQIEDLVIPANYNCPGQLVISGSLSGVEKAVEALKEAGARRALMLKVGGAFHSPLMEPAREELESAIANTKIKAPSCPIYQNVNARPERDSDQIKQNLIKQLTASVRWTQTMQNMMTDGVDEVIEVGGKGKILTGMFKRVNRQMPASVI
ncbi:MAG: ACP S-malonyltransferase [Bacteroidota bacterium]